MPSLDTQPADSDASFISEGTSPRRVSSDRNAVPHVNDKFALRTAASELGVPPRYLRGQAGNKRLALDAQSPGQREFNGLLFRCLTTPQELNPWDCSGGRSFFDLQSYAAWGAATPDEYIISAAAPARVVAHLLPFTRVADDPRDQVAGIPGLRLEQIIGASIHMRHLPTGGRLAIMDPPPPGARPSWLAELLERELKTVRRDPASAPLFRAPTMTEREEHAYLAFHQHSNLLAGLAARIGLWWGKGVSASLRSDRRNSTLGTLTWHERTDDGGIVRRLEEPPLRIQESEVVPEISQDTNPYLCSRGESVELDMRLEPRLSLSAIFRGGGNSLAVAPAEE